MARRKTWSEGVAERRGRKTCLPESQDFFTRQNFSWDLHASRRCPIVYRRMTRTAECTFKGRLSSRPKRGLRFVTAVSNKMSEIERDSALRLWRELSCDWSDPSILAHCSPGFRVPGRWLYSPCSFVSLLISVLLVVGARSTGVRVFHKKDPAAIGWEITGCSIHWFSPHLLS